MVFLCRNKPKVLIEQLAVLSIHVSKNNILSDYDGDHMCYHIMFLHSIKSLEIGKARYCYYTTILMIASITNKKHTKFSFRCFNSGIGSRTMYGKTFCTRFEMVI